MVDTVSQRGLDFNERQEGRVLRAYKCPAGVWTIGVGFTNGSRTVTRMLGKIGPGMRLAQEQCSAVYRAMVDEEYAPPVAKAMPGAAQHELDAGFSVTWNCGPGAMKWSWCSLWRKGAKRDAAAILSKTAITGGGKVLPGLVRRRKEEAALLLNGNYFDHSASGHAGRVLLLPNRTDPPTTEERDYMAEWGGKLARLGFMPSVAVDPRTVQLPRFVAAVRAFQKTHPNLTADGICGPATEAAITRALALRAKATKATAGAVATGGLGEGAAHANPAALAPGWGLWVGSALLVIALLWVAWRYRDELRQMFNSLAGKDVP